MNVTFSIKLIKLRLDIIFDIGITGFSKTVSPCEVYNSASAAFEDV